jgi:broad specificity phosphatase PhoE
MRLYLVRHAQTEWNALQRAQGHTDIALDEVGREQCRRLGRAFRAIVLQRVLSSDLERCRACAMAIGEAAGAEVVLDPRLRERTMGEWEGLPYGEFRVRYHELAEDGDPHLLFARPPGGESHADVWERLGAVQEEIEREEGPLTVVTHGGSGCLLLARLIRAPLEEARSFRRGNASITELERLPDGGYRLVRLSDVSHLDGEPILSGSLDGVSA